MRPVELDEALAILAGLPTEPGTEELPLAALCGRILAEEIRAESPVPPFDKSPFDGYAFRACDVPGELRVVGRAAAGCRELPAIREGEALRIFTGAPVPPGADAVARQEDTAVSGDLVRIPDAYVPGQNLVPRGEDLEAGSLLLSAGTRLSPARLGLLASQGRDKLRVYRRPRAILIPTGTELSEPGEPRGPYGIYNSSSAVLRAVLEKIGFQVEQRSAQRDEEACLLQEAARALKSGAEAVFTTGGASVGDYDFAARTAEKLGLELLIRGVLVKPGGTMLLSRRGRQLFLSLSGNPAAALMGLLAVLRPLLERMCGLREEREELWLPLYAPMPKSSEVCRLLRGHIRIEEGRAWFQEHGGRGNGNLASFVDCDAIALVPPGNGALRRGEMLRVLRLPAGLL